MSMTDREKHELALELVAIRTSTPGRQHSFKSSGSTFDNAYLGARGEIEFADEYWLLVDKEVRPGGDGGIDFQFHVNGVLTTVDVKTTHTPIWLLIQDIKMKRCADWVVLYGFDKHVGEFGRCYFVGWESADIMRRESLRMFQAMDYHRHNSRLRSKPLLDDMMSKRTHEQTNHRDPTPTPSGSLRDGPTQTL